MGQNGASRASQENRQHVPDINEIPNSGQREPGAKRQKQRRRSSIFRCDDHALKKRVQTADLPRTAGHGIGKGNSGFHNLFWSPADSFEPAAIQKTQQCIKFEFTELELC